MTQETRTGIWFIGAWGGAATTALIGLLATQKKMLPPVGLTTELPEFSHISWNPWENFFVGGHEIRRCRFSETAEELISQNALSRELVTSLLPLLAEFDAEIQPGVLRHSGSVVEEMATPDFCPLTEEAPRDIIRRLQRDMRLFAEKKRLSHLIVVNLMSTEPRCEFFSDFSSPRSVRKSGRYENCESEEENGNHTECDGDSSRRNAWLHWESLEKMLNDTRCPLPASTLYAVAALDAGYDFVNFTPSLGATPPALEEFAKMKNARIAGNDGKTGETLMKSVLAPLFAHRNLEVMSWVGHNIFGNRDGIVLDNPQNKATKIASKDHLLEQILGYKPQTLVTIEFIKSMGDWKTAWDHIHFRGFLGTPMTLQFTWQGCDSLLAAPLILDLVRITELAKRRNYTGNMDFLACFFKSPLRVEEQGFVKQFEMLEAWLAEAGS